MGVENNTFKVSHTHIQFLKKFNFGILFKLIDLNKLSKSFLEMSSAIHYRPKHYKASLTKVITFTGPCLELGALKEKIMCQETYDPTQDDLKIIDSQTLKEYRADSELIPKHTTVQVIRIPALKKVRKTS